jgi:hypothetical protein
MATLAIGAVGAFAGNLLAPAGFTFLGMSGAALGWNIGSVVGGMLFSEKQSLPTQYGPRLSDLKVQVSTYGNSIPRVYGAMRLSGNVIWSTPVVETAHSTTYETGGKGGGGTSEQTVVNYTYSQSFAVAICEGAIAGVRKIWANGTLIYNLSDSASIETIAASSSRATGIRIHFGSETQLPDSLIEADKGVGNVPAYRGTAYVVFENLQLADYGNRMPNIELEVVAGVGATVPVVTAVPALSVSGLETAAHNCAYDSGMIKQPSVYTAGGYNYQLFIYRRTLDGALIGIDRYPSYYAPSGNNTQICRNAPWFGLIGAKWANYMESGNVSTANMRPAWIATVGYTHNFILVGGHLYGVFNYTGAYGEDAAGLYFIRIAISADNRPADNPDIKIVLPLTRYSATGNSGCYYDHTAGVFWLLHEESAAAPYLHKLGMDGEILASYACPWTNLPTTLNNFKVENGRILISGTSVRYGTINSDGTITEIFGADNATAGIPVPGLSGIYWSTTNATPMLPQVATATPTLSSVVSAICQTAGMSAGDLDVTDLAADSVAGYVVSRRASARSAIEPLMRAYAFDAVESDGDVVFVKRGGAVAATISADDLMARPYGGGAADDVTLERTQDVELPIEVSVIYSDTAAGFAYGTQAARRLIGSSENKVTVELPLALSAAAARNIADVLMYDAWQGRTQLSFALGTKYSDLEPTDVVQVTKGASTYTARIVAKSEQRGVISFKAVHEDLQVYSQSATAATVPAPDETLDFFGATLLQLLDIPLLRDQDDGRGHYAAACGYLSAWRGAQIYKSTDDGATWDAYGPILLSATPIGSAAGALGTFSQNIFDETNTVSVLLVDGALASATETAVLNGDNVALLGDEIIQFKTATLTADNTYTLSGLLRGRLGTEWARGTHAVGDRFVLLDAATVRVFDCPSSEIGVVRTLRGVSVGGYLDETASQSFTYNAVALEPYAPVLLGGGRDGAGNLTLNWVRRTRVSGAWTNYSDVPLGEDSESYEVDIYTTSGYATVVRTITATSQTCSYTAAQQTTDFGSAQATVYWKVYQLSATVGRGYAGTGAT